MKAALASAWAYSIAFLTRLRTDEPLRNRLYPFIILVSGWIVREGYVSNSVMQIVLGVVFLAGGWSAIEWARRLVTPMTKVGPLIAEKGQQAYAEGIHDAAEAVLGDLSAHAETALRNAVSPEVQALLDRARKAGTYFGNRGEHRAGE